MQVAAVTLILVMWHACFRNLLVCKLQFWRFLNGLKSGLNLRTSGNTPLARVSACATVATANDLARLHGTRRQSLFRVDLPADEVPVSENEVSGDTRFPPRVSEASLCRGSV